MIKKIAFVAALLCLVAAAPTIGRGRQVSTTPYIWRALPDQLNSNDSLALVGFDTTGNDTITDTLGAAGADSGWYDLGPCPSNVADSGVLNVVVGGTGGEVGCSLFVATVPKMAYATPAYLEMIAYDASVITDSLNSTSVGSYPIPWAGKRGHRLWGKFYTYAGGSAIALKRVEVIRDDR